jgi:hypothetical protein
VPRTPAAARRTPVRLAAMGCAALLAVVLTATAASGHASGEVPQARLSATGHTVTLQWTAAPDDIADLAVAAGVWPEAIAFAYLDVAFGGDPALLPDDAEVAAMGRDPALRRYLEDRVRILQDGTACAADARPAPDLMLEGVTVTFECPDEVTSAVVDIRLLHDRDPSYRTFSVDGTYQYAVHTAAQPAHPWDFRAAEASGGNVPVLPVLVGAVAIVLAAALTLARLWSRRPDHPAGTGAEAGRART